MSWIQAIQRSQDELRAFYERWNCCDTVDPDMMDWADSIIWRTNLSFLAAE